MQYDGAYNLTLDIDSWTPSSWSTAGPLLSNGKIGVTLASDGMSSIDSYITGNFSPTVGTYRNNLIDNFDTSTLRLFSEIDPGQIANVRISLAMDVGIATTHYTILSKDLSRPWVNVQRDFYAHRSYPFVFVQTLRMSFTSSYLVDEDAPPPSVFHEYSAPPTLLNVAYHTNSLNVPGKPTVNLLCGNARISSPGREERVLSCATSYLFDTSIASNSGYNAPLGNPSRAYNRVDFDRSKLVSGETYKLHAVTATMSSFDFSNPPEEVQRMLLNLLSRSTLSVSPTIPKPPEDVMSSLRQDHVGAWMKLWSSNVLIEPAQSAVGSSLANVMYLRRSVRVALYNIYSCTRPGVNTEINPMNISVVDRDGSIMFDGDLFFIPTLLFIDSTLARNLLNERFKTLNFAQQLASAYGDRGAKFPYSSDVLGYSQALYWDTVAPVSLFNTPLVAISAWNYFRASHDEDWLQDVGYAILRNVADFILSIVTPVPGTNSYTIPNVTGPSSRPGNDNVFTNYMCALALKYAIECTYQLGKPTKQKWCEVYSSLLIPALEDQANVLKFDESFSQEDRVNIAEPLILTTPYYKSLYMALDDRRNSTTIDASTTFYGSRISPKFERHPYNVFPIAISNAQVAQTLPTSLAGSRIESFQTSILSFLREHDDGLWGNLTSNLTSDRRRNDVNLSAMLILSVLTGPLGFAITGGVTETRYYYQKLGFDHFSSALMPPSWGRVTVTNMGGVSVATVVNNSPGP